MSKNLTCPQCGRICAVSETSINSFIKCSDCKTPFSIESGDEMLEKENAIDTQPATKLIDDTSSMLNINQINSADFEIVNGVLIKYTGTSTEVVIPSGITSIGEFVFFSCRSLTSIIIPSSVMSIGVGAFWGCTSLADIVIPNDVTRIEDHAFRNCKSLPSIIIPGGVTHIGKCAFRNCRSLHSIFVPSNVISIGSVAFGWCTSLTVIEVDERNKRYLAIEGVLFSKNMLEIISYPAGKKRTQYMIPSSVTRVEKGAFSMCKSLTSINIPSSVMSVGGSVFEGCSGLEKIEVDVNNLVYYSQGNCIIEKSSNKLISGCENSIMPNSVISIGSYSFRDCSGLTSITIPNSVTSIEGITFYGCSSLTIYAEATGKPAGWDDYWNSDKRPVVWGSTAT